MAVSFFKIPPLYLGFFHLSWRIVVDGCKLVLTALLEGSDAVGGCQKFNVVAAFYCVSLYLNGSIEAEFSSRLIYGRMVSVGTCREWRIASQTDRGRGFNKNLSMRSY